MKSCASDLSFGNNGGLPDVFPDLMTTGRGAAQHLENVAVPPDMGQVNMLSSDMRTDLGRTIDKNSAEAEDAHKQPPSGFSTGRLMAVASGGGHWVELMLLKSALDPFEPIYVTTDCELGVRDGTHSIREIPDSNRTQFWKSISCAWAAWKLVRELKPSIIVTTGALPGLFCLVFGRIFGAKTIWIDSIANSDQPSLSGRIAKPFAHLWLTQWQSVAVKFGLEFEGAVL